MKIAINGAGVAGTTLAYWLCEFGHQVTLVEHASELRTGGYIIDFWGVGYDVAEKMGMIPALQELRYWADRLHLVDRHGRRCGGYDLNVLPRLAEGRFLALARSDLAATIHARLDARTEMIFGDSIAEMAEKKNCVQVNFDHAAPREFDLVIGADGLHSRVRRLAFGEDAHFEHALGCHAAAFEVHRYQPSDDLVYVAHGAPGKYVARFPVRDGKTFFFMTFRDELLSKDTWSRKSNNKAILEDVFGNTGWECPQILAAMENVEGIYFDSVSQIRMDTWSRGRTVLVGDAAACPSLLAGEGAGLAMAEAYVLAVEIHKCRGDYGSAFSSYEEHLMLFLRQKQKSAEKLLFTFVPKSRLGVTVRNFGTELLRFPTFSKLLLGRHMRDAIELPQL